MKSLTTQQLIKYIDFLQEWANAHSCCKDEILQLRKQYIEELQSRYIDNKFMKYLKIKNQ